LSKERFLGLTGEQDSFESCEHLSHTIVFNRSCNRSGASLYGFWRLAHSKRQTATLAGPFKHLNVIMTIANGDDLSWVDSKSSALHLKRRGLIDPGWGNV
jgi:hypothetical protein